MAMPRSHRRRKNDRSRTVVQRQIAKEALMRGEGVPGHTERRYVRAVLQPHAGEIIEDGRGRKFEVQEDGSARLVAE